MMFRFLNPESDPRWDKFVEDHPLGTIYHLSGWKRVIESSFKHISGTVIVICNKSGQLEAGLPVYLVKSWFTGNRIVSAPFALYCDPLVSEEGQFLKMISYLQELKRKWNASYFEIRMSPMFAYKNSCICESETGISVSNKTHVLDLDKSPDELMMSFGKDVVQSIARANRKKLVLKIGESHDDLKVFYSLLVLSRKRLGLPPIPYLFYESLWNVFKPSEQLKLFFTLYHGQVISTKLFLAYKSSFYSEYTGDLIQYRKFRPNHFLEWEAIKHASSCGYSQYNFGRTAINNKGLMFYKGRWGTVTHELPKIFYPKDFGLKEDGKEASIQYKIVSKIIGRLPIKACIKMGDLIYRHMG